ncbi:MAG TPA: sensor histidine kinase [Sphingobacteriaceae bacterium]|nr:sensor histidine kinase [Sphingobacteriaceae bacterium]
MNIFKKIFLHGIIWTALIAVIMVIATRGQSVRYQTIVIFGYYGLINILIFYINYLLILPTFLNARRYWACAISILVLIIAFGFAKTGIAIIFKEFLLVRGPKAAVYNVNLRDYFLSTLFVSGFFVFMSTAIKFMMDWFVNEKERRGLENEKLIAELAFLRSQINPHFLFNCLNNIYSLSYQKSEKTPEAILKLSEIMRYMLYESNDPRVDLGKEIRYLENFIELQKLRFKSDFYVQLNIEGSNVHQQIVPLVLISFVENAFKHGVITDPENPIKINIVIDIGRLIFMIENKTSVQNKDVTGGIGLSNVRRRLDLLYPEKYTLDITHNDGFYTAKLSIDL